LLEGVRVGGVQVFADEVLIFHAKCGGGRRGEPA
jgi:hypothetical protein